MSLFSRILRDELERQGLSQREAAKRLKVAASFVAHLVLGSRTPPVERVEAWAEALALKGEGRRRFIDAADLAHLPEQAQERWERRMDEHYKLKADYSQLVARVRRVADGE